ncbi:NARF domain-containing protein [Clostridium frigidicarnis]|uniref:Nucleotidyltransferase-Associated Rossmannoid Fold domain-containing protein n=1 Tax=Clostridium frigidicarnis TaxID=84698 RepID=A0A1I0V6N9_9CLOT|nr:NARF domain-containing protein [Clostridium frigidicarnis]SFA71740.1 hypothetical protein SAMN04488528_1001180 [Clostridium frigidicarnis]
MKRIYKTLSFIVLFIIIFCPYAYAVNNENMSKEEIMNKYYELKEENQKLKDKYSDLQEKWGAEKIDIDNKKSDLDDRVKVIEIYGGVFAGILTVLGVSLWPIIKNKAKEVAENITDREINKKVHGEIKHIKLMIDDCKKEEFLMKNKTILAISKEDDDENKIKDLLKNFKKLETVMLDKRPNNLNGYDVILFNNIKGGFQKKEMQEIIQHNNNSKAVYFYFNKSNERLDIKNDNINYATNDATICGNLLDLLKYQEDILIN